MWLVMAWRLLLPDCIRYVFMGGFGLEVLGGIVGWVSWSMCGAGLYFLIVRWNSCWYWAWIFPKADFVLFSDQLGRDFVRRMLLAGSSFHMLMKDAPLAEVNQCLRDVNGGVSLFVVRRRICFVRKERSKIEWFHWRKRRKKFYELWRWENTKRLQQSVFECIYGGDPS